MSTPYRIRWKGRTEGPYSREEIITRLASGELSLLHRIEVSGKWIGLGEFFAEPGTPAAAAAGPPTERKDFPAAQKRTVHAALHGARPVHGHPANAEFLCNLGYFLCGLSFVLPVAATIPAVSLAVWHRRHDDRNTARIQFILSGLLTALGIGFWAAVSVAYRRGMI